MSRSGKSRIPRLLVFLLVIAGLVVSIIVKEHFKSSPVAPLRSTPPQGNIKVLDGDTFVDSAGDTVRLLGIDTPEKGQAFANDAAESLRHLLSGNGKLRYEFGKERNDRYGRLLAFVYTDSLFVNERLIEDGLASTYFFEDQLSAVVFAELCNAQQAAIRAKIGIWSLTADRPESAYYGNQRSRRFHRPDCSAVTSGESARLISNPTRDYFLGECYSPCRNCKP